MDGAPPPEEDFSILSIADRLTHKNWKARVSGYESLIKTFQATASESDPAFRPYISNGELLKKIALDANAVAQEKGIEALVAFVKFAGESAARTREDVLPAVVDKCLGSTRAGTRINALELVLQYVEMENSADGCVRDILSGLGAKQPKTVAGCVGALKEIVRVFGIQPVSPAPVLKALPKIFGHTDKTVRAEGTTLCQTIYQCIGAAIQPSLADLKPVQVKELTESFEKMDADGKGKGSLTPERYTRDEARKRESAPADVDEAAAEPEEVDPRSFAEEVNIVPQMPANFQTNLASSKWKDRKEALDEFLVVLQKALRIQDVPDLGDIVKALSEKMKDVNINCVIVAANCLEALAKGLGSSFAKYKDIVIPPILDRMKERKATVTDALGAALDSVFASTSLPDIIDLVIPFLSNKSPQVKEGTLKFMHRCLSTTTKPPAPAQVKPLADSLAITLGDTAEVVRDVSAQALGCLMKIVGDRAMNPILEPLDDIRKAKVKEQADKATVKCKAGAPGPPKPVPAAAAPVASKKKAPVAKKPESKAASSPSEPDPTQEASPPAPPKKGPPARLTTKKPPAAAAPAASAPSATKKPTPAAAATAASKGSSAPAPSTLDTFKYKHTPEAAEELAAEMIPASINSDLSDANWKLRLSALEEMITWLEGGAVETVDSEVIVRFLSKKSWNEKNFQVSSKAYLVLSMLAERCPSFGRSSVALGVGHLCEKLGDIKLKKPAGDTLGVFAEKTSLSFVLNQAYEPLSKQKAPKVIADSIAWINTSLTEFGISGLSLRALIDFLKEGLKNSNAAVRTSATNCLVTVKLFAGGGIKDLIQDLNPQLLGTITSEFDKADGTPAPVPTRHSAEVATAPSGGAGKSGSSDPLDDLFPRVELDKLLGGTTILADAKSDNFKVRKEALEALQAILDIGQNKRLKPTMGEIREVLKSRVTDSNKAVQVLALDLIARIAAGMSKPFDKYSRLYVVPVCSVLADQKANIRSAGLVTLTAIADACEGLDSMISGVATSLETANPMLRSSLTGWLVDYIKDHEGKSLPDLSPLAGPLVICLDDRNGDVRKGSLAVMPYVIGQIGFDKVESHTSSLKPASKTAVMPLLQQARTNALPVGGHTSAKPSAPKAMSAAITKPPSPTLQERASSPAPASQKPGGIPNRATGVRRLGGIPSRPESRTESIKDVDSAAPTAVSRLAKPGTGLRRPTSMAFPPVSAPPPPAAHPASYFLGSSADVKRLRLAKDLGRWIVEGPPVRKDLADVLQHQMEGHVSEDVLKHLFSTGHDPVADYVTGITEMLESLHKATSSDLDEVTQDELRASLLANSDLILKYMTIRIHEPPPNLVAKCLDLLDGVLTFFRTIEYQISDTEAQCFTPTLIHKLGDAREPVRNRVSVMLQSLSRVYAYSRIFQLLLEHGLKSKVAKTRQGSLDELSNILKRSGLGACDPGKAFPVLATMISDKDSNVRKAALGALSEGYVLVGDKIWGMVGSLSPKDKTQLEERLRRVPAPATTVDVVPSPAVARVAASGLQRPQSPGLGSSRIGAPSGMLRPASPSAVSNSRISRPSSPSRGFNARSASPGPSLRPSSTSTAGIPRARPTSMLPSRLAAPRSRPTPIQTQEPPVEESPVYAVNGETNGQMGGRDDNFLDSATQADDITITISSILSNDPGRSVEALKKIQKILDIAPEASHTSAHFRELSDHTEGLIETITLQMGHVFDKVDLLVESGTFRLAKHLIQTLNAFCDHTVLAESLTVDTLKALLEELTLRLLYTDESKEPKIKDLSRFINMLILRLFAVGRRVAVFRALFGLLLQLVKPFPSHGTLPDAPEARVAELVLKCVWKLARNIPGDLEKNALDPVELFPAIEHFLQSIPPNEWRARATNRVPSGDMPLRTIKVIIQHVVAHYGSDDTYDILTQAFDDPSATIVYPYVFRILNSSARNTANGGGDVTTRTRMRSTTNGSMDQPDNHYGSASPPRSSAASTSSGRNHTASPSRSSARSRTPPLLPSAPVVEEPDPDALLLKIIDHISSETTGALHKEGITELHQFIKSYPQKKPKVDKLLEATGPAFRKYIARALASRAAEDQEREGGTPTDILSRVDSIKKENTPSAPSSPSPMSRTNIVASTSSPRRQSIIGDPLPGEDRLSRLHDVFQYRRNVAAKEESRLSRASMTSNGSGSGLPGRSESAMDSQ